MDNRRPLVTIVTVNYNGKKYLKNCLDSLFDLNYPKNKLEIIMVDNCSTDGSIGFIKGHFPGVKIIENDINNYCRANNLGIKHTKGKYIAFLNNDTQVDKNWLIELVKVIKSDKSIGGVGSKILFMDGRIESVGHRELPNFYWLDKGCNEKDCSQYDELEKVNSLCGCAVLYRKSALEDVNNFDEDFNMYLEDIDISIGFREKGWKLIYVPKSLIRHKHHGTVQEDSALFYTERNRLLLLAKHYPKKLNNALLGRGYFTVQRDIKMQGSLYKMLPDLISKLIKHHKVEIVKDVLGELLRELSRISNYENNILVDKVRDLLKSIEYHQGAINEKDSSINKLNLEIEKRGQSLKEKNQHIDNLNLEIQKRGQTINEKDSSINKLNLEIEKRGQEINDIYNSTAFKFLVRPLWALLWKIKQTIKNLKIFKLSSKELIEPREINIITDDKENINVSNIGICTIISKNYLAYARVLTESFLKYNIGKVFVLLTDGVDGYFDPNKEKFTLIEIDAIKDRIKNFEKFCFQYNTTELNTAVKPFFLEFLLEKYKLQKLIFFDPDILITHNLDYLFGLLEKFSIVLIPHITRPFNDTYKPFELDILRSGVYNLGFIALSNKDSTRTLLDWWKERLQRYSRIDFQVGLFVDQKWIDLIPGFFKDVFILRDISYNIAYWNLHYRKVYMEGENILVNGRPVHFLHFSGLEFKNPNSISKHQDRFKLNDLKQMKPVFELYKNKLIANGHNISKNWPCIFGSFDNGAAIPDIVRRVYSEIHSSGKNKFSNPFNTLGKDSYFNWLNEKIDNKNPRITRFMYEIYKKRTDVQIVYPNIFGTDREAFFHWFLRNIERELKLESSFLERIFPFSAKNKQQVLIKIETLVFYKIRNTLKFCFKKIFKNNLWVINNLKITERRLNRRIVYIRSIFSRKAKCIKFIKKSNNNGEINVFGYLTAELGVGEAARTSVKSLKAAGIGFSLINIDNHSVSRKCDFSFSEFSEDNPYDINLIHINADMFAKLYAEKGWKPFRDKYNIGFWNWELSDFPEEWQESFNYCSEIWTPSSFSHASISNKSPVPVVKIPFAVSVNKPKKIKRNYFGLDDTDFIFLFIFDFFSYFERKNPLAIIEAYKKAFSASEKAKLLIKCCNSSYDSQAMHRLREAAKGYNIDIIDKYFYRDEISALIYLSDCYISLHRSEGFGLTMAEAMFLEKPVIATAYSGNVDFMNVNNSYLVKYKLVEVDKDIGPYKKGYIWANPDTERAAELMRYVYKNREAAKEVGKIASADMLRDFNCNVIGSQIKNRINYIYKNFHV